MALTWLILFIVVAIALAMLLWPDKGLAARWKRWRAAVEREQVEDALKVLLDHKWEGLATSSDALVAHLSLSAATVLRLVTRMEAQGLVQTRGSELALTAEGERWALQVVRAYRLWERYLASEARMPLAQIHGEAHHLEHGLTPEQVNDLDAALGYPLRDPHGDPIPSRNGDLPVQKLALLEGLHPGQQAVVCRVDNEDPDLLRYLTTIELVPQARITVLERSNFDGVLRLEVGEGEVSLGPRLTGQIYVEVIQNTP